MKISFCFVLTALVCAELLSVPAAAASDAAVVRLPDHRFAVLAEGAMESASIGSYSIAVFQDKELTELRGGGVFSRDGSLFEDSGKPRVQFADITGDGVNELILSTLTGGSGN